MNLAVAQCFQIGHENNIHTMQCACTIQKKQCTLPLPAADPNQYQVKLAIQTQASEMVTAGEKRCSNLSKQVA